MYDTALDRSLLEEARRTRDAWSAEGSISLSSVCDKCRDDKKHYATHRDVRISLRQPVPVHGEAGRMPAAVAPVARRAESVRLIERAAELLQVQRLRRGRLERSSVALQAVGWEPSAERVCNVRGPLRTAPVRRQNLRFCNSVGIATACRSSGA